MGAEYAKLQGEEAQWQQSSIAGQEELMAQFETLQSEFQAGSLSLVNIGAETADKQAASFGLLESSAKEASAAMTTSLDEMGKRADMMADRVTKAMNRAAAAMKSFGLAGSSGSKSSSAAGVKKAATGFSGLVTEPTMFLAGEAGPETVNIAPVQGGGSAKGNITVVVVTQLDGREVARTVNKLQGQMMQ